MPTSEPPVVVNGRLEPEHATFTKTIPTKSVIMPGQTAAPFNEIIPAATNNVFTRPTTLSRSSQDALEAMPTSYNADLIPPADSTPPPVSAIPTCGSTPSQPFQCTPETLGGAKNWIAELEAMCGVVDVAWYDLPIIISKTQFENYLCSLGSQLASEEPREATVVGFEAWDSFSLAESFSWNSALLPWKNYPQTTSTIKTPIFQAPDNDKQGLASAAPDNDKQGLTSTTPDNGKQGLTATPHFPSLYMTFSRNETTIRQRATLAHLGLLQSVKWIVRTTSG